jgi:hypothetical protein
MNNASKLSPRAAALVSIAAMREYLERVEAKVRDSYTDATDEVYFSLGNELMYSIKRLPDGLGVEEFDTFSEYNEGLQTAAADSAGRLALSITEGTANCMAEAVAVALCDAGFEDQGNGLVEALMEHLDNSN